MLAIGAVAGCKSPEQPIPVDRRVMPLTPDDTTAMKEFETKIANYVEIHRRLESALPKLPNDATPEQIDRNQRALGESIKVERANAKQGDFFSPAIENLVRRTMEVVLGGKDGKTIRASIMDENPGMPNLSVNDRWPDSIPLSTMPPQVLEPLPALVEDLEYRFIGERMVLLDTHAHIILDYTGDVLPAGGPQ
jgi:hypothetical protein